MKRLLLFLFLISQLSVLADTEEWIQKANLPASGRHGATSFSIGNKGYVGMGHINSGAQGDYSFNDLWEYDVATNSWTQKADYPGTPFHYGTSFAYHNKGYIGYDYEFYTYSPVTNTYNQLQPPAIGLHWNKTIIYNDVVVLSDYISMYLYNPVFDSWMILTDYSNFKKEVLLERDNKMYALGFVQPDNWMLAEWNPSTQNWDSISAYPDTIHKSHLCGFTLNDDFYFSLGSPSEIDVGKVNWKYDFKTKEWTRLEDFGGAGRRYYTSFKIENKAYICTGTNGTNMNNLWEFVPEDTSTYRPPPPKPPIIYNSLPYPNPSNNLVFIDLDGNVDGLTYTLKLYDINGQLVQELITSDSSFVISGTSLASGHYFYFIKLNGQPDRRGRFEIAY